MAQEKRIDIRVILKGKIAKEFEQLKKYYGMENRTDFVRFLIHNKFEELKFNINKEKDQE
ncbi:MAG: hypothetical protein ACTSO3_16675 [Candidatus Heimdallarchaeaceae archaeon]